MSDEELEVMQETLARAHAVKQRVYRADKYRARIAGQLGNRFSQVVSMPLPDGDVTTIVMAKRVTPFAFDTNTREFLTHLPVMSPGTVLDVIRNGSHLVVRDCTMLRGNLIDTSNVVLRLAAVDAMFAEDYPNWKATGKKSAVGVHRIFRAERFTLEVSPVGTVGQHSKPCMYTPLVDGRDLFVDQ